MGGSMEKDMCYKEIMNRIEATFTPTKQERERIARRLNLLNEEEMNNLYKNFTLIGIDTILEYLCAHYC